MDDENGVFLYEKSVFLRIHILMVTVRHRLIKSDYLLNLILHNNYLNISH